MVDGASVVAVVVATIKLHVPSFNEPFHSQTTSLLSPAPGVVMHAFFFKMPLQGFAGVELLVPVLVLSLAVPVVLLLLVVLDTVVVVAETSVVASADGAEVVASTGAKVVPQLSIASPSVVDVSSGPAVVVAMASAFVLVVAGLSVVGAAVCVVVAVLVVVLADLVVVGSAVDVVVVVVVVDDSVGPSVVVLVELNVGVVPDVVDVVVVAVAPGLTVHALLLLSQVHTASALHCGAACALHRAKSTPSTPTGVVVSATVVVVATSPATVGATACVMHVLSVLL